MKHKKQTTIDKRESDNINNNNNINNDNNNNNQINLLKKQLLEEKNNNKKLIYENQLLNDEIKKLKKEDKEMKAELNILNDKFLLLKGHKKLEKKFDIQYNSTRNIKPTTINLFQNSLIIQKKSKNKNISVLFMTHDNQDIIKHEMTCKKTDLFVKLEEKLYEDFPQYKNYVTFFKNDTNSILRFKTMEENKIKNNDIITLFIKEEEE